MFATQLSSPASHPLEARHLLYHFDAQLSLHTIGVVAEGLRMANRFEGRITSGLLCGARVWGIDHFVVRRDGVGIIDAEKTITLGDVSVYEHVRGYCLPDEGLTLPPLSVMAQPDFAWPDLDFPMRGFSFFRAATTELAHLDREVACVIGRGNFHTGALSISTFSLSPLQMR